MDHDEEEGPFLEPANNNEEEEEEEEEEQPVQGGSKPGPTLADIFGESDLSDLSDQEDSDEEQAAPAPKSKSKHTYREEEPSEGEEASSEEDDPVEKGGDGEYQGGNDDDREDGLKALKFKKKPKQKKAREEGEEGEGGEVDQPRKKKKKSAKKVAEDTIEEPEEYIEPEVAARRALHARIDAIVKKPKSTMRKKSKGEQDDDLDAMNDEAITKLRSDMFIAADADIEENESGKFAFHKLRMLPEVVKLMQKTSLAESIVDNGLLEAVRKWLEPLADGSLPAVNIQRPLFEILRTLTIDTSALRTCGLGKIVYFYTKCKRVEPSIARMANSLVSDWMRPIIRNSKSLADREIEITREAEPRHRGPGGTMGRIAGTSSSMRAAELAAAAAASQSQSGTPASVRPTNETIARRHARIPEMLTATFKVAPMKDARDRENGNGMSSSNVVVGGKMKGYKKKLIAGQQASRRV